MLILNETKKQQSANGHIKLREVSSLRMNSIIVMISCFGTSPGHVNKVSQVKVAAEEPAAA